MEKQTKELDLVIIGGGPAGLTAAIYGSRAKLDLLLLEDSLVGGQIRSTYTVDNYPGFQSVSGNELADKMQAQAESLGANIDEFDSIVSVSLSDDEKIIETESYIYKPKAVIIATGSTPRKLPVPEETTFSGKGIHYCAVCDGAMYEGKKIAIVGGGNSALEEALFLSKFGEVTIIRRYDYFNGEKSTLEEVLNNDKIKILWNEDIKHVKGSNMVESVVIENTKTGEIKEISMDGVFVSIGTMPKTDLFKDYITLTKGGNIVTDEYMQTNIKGVYAAGDVRDKMFRQITTAVSDGTIASLMAEKYINDEKGR